MVAALGAHASSLEARRARSHDGHALLLRCSNYHMGHRRLAPCGGIVHTERLAACEQTIDTVIGAHALTNLVNTALLELIDNVRVGEVGTGHADEIDMAVGDRACGRSNVHL